MRTKTQVLIAQNYEALKQRMLSDREGGDTVMKTEKKEKILQTSTQKTITGIGIFSLLSKQNKKRKEGEVATQANAKFTYKFKEGHSKNFKRELPFTYFIAAAQ